MKNVAIIDSDRNGLREGVGQLTRAGYQVNSMDTLESIRDLSGDDVPDILLFANDYPGLDSEHLCQQLRQDEAWKNVPLVIMVNSDDYNVIEKAFNDGVADFITKPTDWKMVAYRLQYLLSATHAHQKLNHAVSKIEKNEQDLLALQRVAKMGSWQWHVMSNELYCSPEVNRSLCIDDDDSLSYEKLLSFIAKDDLAKFKIAINKVLTDGRSRSIEHKIKAANGEEGVVLHRFMLNLDDSKEDELIISATMQNISDRKNFERKIYYMANYDCLTNLPNREKFAKQVSDSMYLAERTKTSIAIMFVDLDRFKRINDTVGHMAADKLLAHAAERIAGCLRNYDAIAKIDSQEIPAIASRFGGDEFALMIPHCNDLNNVASVAQRILDQICEPIYIEGQELYCTASIGISVYPDNARDLDTLLSQADAAMYDAKNASRNAFSFYSESMNRDAKQQLSLQNDLRTALQKNELFLLYQPKVDIIQNQLTGVEALLRWQHPERGLVMPDDFIPIAEESGLMNQIGDWVLTETGIQLANWINSGRAPINFAVNVSNRQFNNPGFIDRIAKIVSDPLIPHQYMELEITEGVVMNNIDESVDKLNQLKAHGVKLSIDDFGTGYSSFNYLKDLPLDMLKIDKSFIQDLEHNDNGPAIVKAIIDMSHALGLRVTAEGAENVSQVNFLQEHHCDEIQGYYYGKPGSLKMLSQLYERLRGVKK